LSAQKVDDETFCRLFDQLGAAGVAKVTGLDLRGIYRRRRNLERYVGAILPPSARSVSHPHRIELEVKDGVVLVGSDGHYWPGEPSTAHLAFVKLCKELKPVAVIMNGDAFDGASISRHPPIGWENNPTVKHEVETVQERLGEIETAAGHARKIWPLGNHDARFETRLATVAPEYSKITGVHLSDHFPLWEGCWSCWINNDVVIKHRIKGGVHATHNNTVAAGKTTVTGHLHSLKVTPYNDYNGLRWGIDTGTLANPYGPQFVDYTEDSPRNHRSGFVVLTFRDGKLQWPEVVYVIEDGLVGFRGQIINVNQTTSIRSAHLQAPHRRRAARSTAPRRADTTSKTNRKKEATSARSNAGGRNRLRKLQRTGRSR
jgi:hypothetical protein